ncbi:hypothetical protein [Kitasatospora sp. NPDC085879]|uniref:ATP-binding protein n=1 Tax=Kitasatospora sp. NPDC085879 TaxID=3154769 RepID=UPI003438DDCF
MCAPENNVERDIPFAPEAVADLRTWAAAVLEKWDLDDLVFATELILSELATNAIRYGTPPARHSRPERVSPPPSAYLTHHRIRPPHQARHAYTS